MNGTPGSSVPSDSGARSAPRNVVDPLKVHPVFEYSRVNERGPGDV